MADPFELDHEPKRLSDVTGFRTGSAACGVKSEGPDVGVLLCETAAKLGWADFLGKLKGGTGETAALTTEAHGAGGAVYSGRSMRAAPVVVSEDNGGGGALRAVVVNAGNANCYTGRDGVRAADAMLSKCASDLEVPEKQIIVASAGPSGVPFPREKVIEGVATACADARDGGAGDFEGVLAAGNGPCIRASASGMYDGKPFTIAGVARRAADDVLDMAPMFTFLVTDLAISKECLASAITSVYEQTYACAVTDPALGANDTLCLLSSGRAGNAVIDVLFSATVLSEALEAVVKTLMVGPGTGGVHGPYEIRVVGASTESEAGTIANSLAWSSLLRDALREEPPSWERIVSAAGSASSKMDLSLTSLQLCGETVFIAGRPVETPPESLPGLLAAGPVEVEFDLGVGDSKAVMWSYPTPTQKSDDVAAAERRAEEAGATARTAVDAKKRLAEVQKEATSLRAERDGLAAQIADSGSLSGDEVASLQEKITAAEVAVEEANASAARAADAAASELEAKRAELEEEFGEARQKAEDDLAQAATALEELEKERDELRASVEALEEARDEVASGADAAQSDLQTKLEEAVAARANADEQLAALEEANQQGASEAADVQNEMKAKLTEADDARKKAEGEAQQALAKADELQKTLEKTRGDAATAGEVEKERAKELEKLRAEAEAAKESAQEQAEKLAEVTKVRDAAAKKRDELQKQLEEMLAVTQKASAVEEGATAKIDEATAAREAAEKERDELRAKVEAVEKERDEQRSKVESAGKASEGKLKEALDAQKKADAELAEAKKGRTEAESKLAESAKKLASVEKQLEASASAGKATKDAESKLAKETESKEAAEKERDDVKGKFKELKKVAKQALTDFEKTKKKTDKDLKTATAALEKAEKARDDALAKLEKGGGKGGDSKEAKKRIAGLEKKLGAAEEARDKALLENKDLHAAQAKAGGKSAGKVATDTQAIEANIKEIKADRDEKAKKLEKVTAERDDAVAQARETKEMLAQAMSKTKEKPKDTATDAPKEMSEDAEKQIKKLKRLIKQYESAHQSAREEVGKLHTKYEDLSGELRKAQAELQLKEQLVKQLLGESKK